MPIQLAGLCSLLTSTPYLDEECSHSALLKVTLERASPHTRGSLSARSLKNLFANVIGGHAFTTRTATQLTAYLHVYSRGLGARSKPEKIVLEGRCCRKPLLKV